MPPDHVPITWPGDRALLLCHGVGNYGPGDYDAVKDAIHAAIGDAAWSSLAVYEVFYDDINDWFAAKVEAGRAIDRALGFLKTKFGNADVGDVAAEAAGDVVWPVLSLAARDALRRVYIRRLIQMVVDGINSGHSIRHQKIVLMGHSLGCFHTYEALWAITTDPGFKMQPLIDGPVFENVILLASPVQLIRSVAGSIGALVPQPQGLATLHARGLAIPATTVHQRRIVAAKKLVSLTGTMDPVGGHLLGDKLEWAYMTMDDPTFEPKIEPQRLVTTDADRATLVARLRELLERRDPGLSLDNPHSWESYVTHNAGDIARWLGA